ncbi:MAG: MAPEG family protein, partial [Pseudomonadota bacterium]
MGQPGGEEDQRQQAQQPAGGALQLRQGAGVSLGDGGDLRLQRRTRAQGNLVEYAPLFLILLALAEMQGAAGWLL